jgi:cytidine deaminase
MRCHICNSVLEENEIKWNKDHEDYDPCGVCLDIINEVFEPLDEETIHKQLELELEGDLDDGLAIEDSE